MLLDKITDRKPISLLNVRSIEYSFLSDKVKKELTALPIKELKNFNPLSKIKILPQRSLIKNKKDIYYVNNEGYDYPRYILKIKNYIF